MSMLITGIGTATPHYHISQSDAYDLTTNISCDTPAQRRMMKAIYRRVNVRERGSVLLKSDQGTLTDREDFLVPRLHAEDRGPSTSARMAKYDQEALPLALEASRAALQEAGQTSNEVTHLVTASCSGFSAPGFDIGLIKELGLSPNTPRTHVGFMGCHGGFNALRVAGAFVSSDPHAVALVCSLELCSLHHYYGWDSEKVIANGLFADGAGAVVCRSDQERIAAPFRVLAHGSTIIEESSDAMSWTIGDNGFEMTLSSRVPAIIEWHLAEWMETFLRSHGQTIASIGAWAIHPGGPRILDACRDALGISNAHLSLSREVLASHGNMSSATMFFLLNKLSREPKTTPIVALGFGPGLTVEAMLMT